MKTHDRIGRLSGLLFCLCSLLCGCSSSDRTEPLPPVPPEPVTCSFSVRVSDLTPTEAKITVVPEKADFPYCFTVVSEDAYDSAEGEAAPLVTAMIEQATAADPSLTQAEAVARIRRTGNAGESVSGLSPRTVYFALAVGIDEKGNCTTAPAFERFTTPAEPQPAGGFTVRVSDIEATRATVSVTPDDDEMPYYYDLVTAADYDACGGDLSVIVSGLIDFLLGNNPGTTVQEITATIRSNGPDGDQIGSLPPSTDFYAFAVGLADDGTCTTEATVEPFRTLDAGDPKDCTFSFAFSERSSSGVLVKVTPSDPSIGYFTSVISEQEYGGDANLTARIQQAIAEIAAQEQIGMAEAVEILAWRGISSEYQDGLEPSTDYYAFAYALASDGSAAGPLFKERFTTLGLNTSTAAVTVSVDKYFDGTALEAADPERFAGYSGKVCVLVTAVPSDDAEHWYTAMGGGDMTDPYLYPEETTIEALLQGGTQDKLRMRYIGRWGEATLIGVAVDGYYQFGEVFRKRVDLQPEHASPVEEFDPDWTSLPLSEGILMQPAEPSPNAAHRSFHPAERITRRLPADGRRTFRLPMQ